jgi:hypothetical protein
MLGERDLVFPQTGPLIDTNPSGTAPNTRIVLNVLSSVSVCVCVCVCVCVSVCVCVKRKRVGEKQGRKWVNHDANPALGYEILKIES